MDAVDSCDLNLYEMGEDGKDPTDFKISFIAGSVLLYIENFNRLDLLLEFESTIFY